MQIQVLVNARERLRDALMRLLSFVLLVVHLFQLFLSINRANHVPGKPGSVNGCCDGETVLDVFFSIV
jgi:hypothetical protein